MAVYNWTNQQAKADQFQVYYDQWWGILSKRKMYLDFPAAKIKKMYQKDPIFKQFVDIAKQQEKFLNKIRDIME